MRKVKEICGLKSSNTSVIHNVNHHFCSRHGRGGEQRRGEEDGVGGVYVRKR